MTPEERFQELIDKHEIHDLMVRYAERIDAKDAAGAAACFAEDGIGVYWGDYQGPAAIAERLTGILGTFVASSYHLSNVQITVDGDTADAFSYVYAFHRLAADQSASHYWGRWVDRLKRERGQWRFARREVVGVDALGTVDDDVSGFPGHPGRL